MPRRPKAAQVDDVDPIDADDPPSDSLVGDTTDLPDEVRDGDVTAGDDTPDEEEEPV